MKSLIQILGRILDDSRIWCSAATSRDLQTITTRVEHEGLSFLTITLPTFCQDFERSLAAGRVDSNAFPGFRRRGALPRFLGGLLCLVFDSRTGDLLPDPNINAIFFIRQICLTFKKIESPCSDTRVRAAYSNYLETNVSVQVWENELDPYLSSDRDEDLLLKPREVNRVLTPYAQLNHFNEVCKLLWGDHSIPESSWIPEHLLPKHGPGATAERILGNQKYVHKTWHQRLELLYPSDLCIVPNWNFADDLKDVTFSLPGEEQPVRVVTVPKTLKGPRIIAIEPVCMQYAQQAILDKLVPILEKSDLFNGALGFTDQTVNQDWALESSKSGRYATIDLKDASDRVSSRLVYEMLRNIPVFREYVFASRSLRADVPDYGVLPLYRFASMGSALCFPIEAMVFYTIVLSAITRAQGRQPSIGILRSLSKEVRIYGDDIIIPVEYAQSVIDELEWFNLRVNDRKSFYSGKFRESCGLDAYDGVPVTPAYFRRMLPQSRRNTSELLSLIAFRNQVYKLGLWATTEYVDNLLARLIPMPVVADTSPIKGRFSYLGYEKGTRFCKNTQRHMVKGIITASIKRKSMLDNVWALMKCLLQLERRKETSLLDPPQVDKDHLKYSGRPESVYTKIQWASPY